MDSTERRQQEKAIAKYRELASGYDAFMARTLGWRQAAVDALELEAGHTVVDVACGTGGNFELILDRIGPDGTLIGIDLSSDMLAIARERVKQQEMANVVLIRAPIQEAALAVRGDRALFSFTHDVLQSPRAVENVGAQLGPGARVAAVGSKRASRWNFPVNAAMRLIASRYVTSFRNFDRPWSELERIAELEIGTFALGAIYVASGPIRQPGARDER